ncbi:hypothetical protein A9P82_05030 [Arachidicoccus ginsenosidimutans]|nr:hypothetical protein A9P82_05030 [Arachidicoccus sp. BS20]
MLVVIFIIAFLTFVFLFAIGERATSDEKGLLRFLEILFGAECFPAYIFPKLFFDGNIFLTFFISSLIDAFLIEIILSLFSKNK